ncbi:MAG: ThuA domain-containing protein [Fibrobacteres bacterium]|nr:ThuA domain-containing protein [Fibrobacterota bacterium]
MEKGHKRNWPIAIFAFILIAQDAPARLQMVLHYYKTGYKEWAGGVAACRAALDSLGNEYHFTVKHSADTNDLIKVADYDLVVFDNATDAGGVTGVPGAPQMALRKYMEAGGKFLAFGAAADHRGKWDWYDTVLFSGARFQSFGLDNWAGLYRPFPPPSGWDPELLGMWGFLRDSLKIPVDSVLVGSAVAHLNIDIAAAPGIKVLQEVRGANAWNTYGEGFTWTRQFPAHGGRMLYTALGHQANDWTDNGAWLRKATYGYMKYLMGDFIIDLALAPPGIHARGSRLEVRRDRRGSLRVTDVRGRLVPSAPF